MISSIATEANPGAARLNHGLFFLIRDRAILWGWRDRDRPRVRAWRRRWTSWTILSPTIWRYAYSSPSGLK